MAAFLLRKGKFYDPEVKYTIFLPDLMYDDVCKETKIIIKMLRLGTFSVYESEIIYDTRYNFWVIVNVLCF